MSMRFMVFTLVLAALLAAAEVGSRFVDFAHRPVTPAAPVIIRIAPGEPFGRIAQRLEDEGLVSGAGKLKLLARWRKAAQSIKAGEYEFREAASPDRILERLVSGDILRVRVTIPEGLSMKEIAAKLEAEGFGKAEDFMEFAQDRDFAEDLGIAQSSLEGYLFPETYTLFPSMAPDEILTAMVKEFSRRLTPELKEAAKKHGLSPHQLVTLASIIQKETGVTSEMPVISAVFHNRLKKGMPLQADPTVIYGIGDFDGNITKKDLLADTPYNTYRIAGLPPGPIASPGEDALKAAAFPAEAKYLYFVAKGDGTHAFSATLKAHNQAVQKYQLRR